MNLEEYYDNIYRYCYLHTQNRHTAEDLTQETFLKFLETSNYQDRGKPLAFLYTIARNLCIDHIRQNSKSSDACRRAAEAFIPAAADTELAATSVALSQAVKELSETDHEIICLRYVLEMNPGEIGRIMDLSRFSPWQLSRKPDIRHAAAWKSWNFPHGFPCMRSFVKGSASWERKTCSCWESCCLLASACGKQIWSYCPAKLISVTGSLLEPRLVPFFGTYLASWQFGPFLYLLLSVCFALGGYHIYRRWQAGGR